MNKDTLDIYENALADKTDRYPFIVRVYGVLSIIAGGVQVFAAVLTVLLFFAGRINVSEYATLSTTTLVIAIVAAAVSTVLAGMFIVLGIRLLRGKRHRAALLANIMFALEAIVLLCQLMLTGISMDLTPALVNMVILVALQTYSDPALRQERILQRKLQQLEVKAQAEDGTLGRDASGKGYISLNYYNIFWVFVICSIIGLVIEIIYHMTIVDPGQYESRAGLLYGPFSPIYGVGAVLMTTALNRFHDRNPVLIFLISALIGGGFEFFVSWFMETAFGITAWDYTGAFLSIDGRTCGLFMAMWGVLGLAWVKFALPIMLKVINAIPWNWRYALTVACTALMLIDAWLTLASLDCWYEREAGKMDYAHASAIAQFCNEHYDNEFMAHRFQTMQLDPSSAARAS